MKTLSYAIVLLLLILASPQLRGQDCSASPYNSPGAPSNCTYVFTSSGWFDSGGSPISAPTTINSSQSICILANNSNNFTLIKGTFYVGPEAIYSGSINGFNNGSTLIVEGSVSLPTNTSFNSTDIFIESTGTFTYPAALSPGGSTMIKNKGFLDVMGNLSTSGSGTIINYEDARIDVQGDGSFNSLVKNCGILEVAGSITGSGGSGLQNYCSTYVHGNMSLNGDFTSNGLIIIDGDLSVNGSVFYNNSTLLLNNLNLTNDQIVGNNDTSLLIVRQNAQLSNGASIEGHYFYDIDDGGGFDSVCGSCTEQVDIVTLADIPTSNEEILSNCGAAVTMVSIIEESKIDFDGVDDFISTPKFIDGLNNVTLMSWVLSDSGNSANMSVAGEDVGFRLWLKNGNIPTLTIKTNAVSSITLSATSVINYNEWHHLTGTFSGDTGIMMLYVDGILSASLDIGVTGSTIAHSTSSNGNFEIGRRSTNSGSEYFKGDIDEVRVFNVVLSESQIKQMIYQEIENNSGLVKGQVIVKNISDFVTNATISWSSLLAYYPFSDIVSQTRTTDFSSNKRITRLHNIASLQGETAPLPFITKSNGDWTSANTWLHGDLWDVNNIATYKDGSIIKIANDVTLSHSVKTLGLIVDEGKKLSVIGDEFLENTWYLELNGTIDLQNDSQLIQSDRSDLVTSANGKILRRQEGSASAYWYNYWGSPVGSVSATTFNNNNTNSNNLGNTSFNLGMLKKPDGTNFEFTNSLHATGKISTYWLYTYKNGV
ncbi:MAG: LamG domain-containing protein, partial [Winogradskyella sp.]|uniref:LamG domain-containing protein n=1 Tax=Winogradskyella sp. TaxID=1883156 RepID=UPI0017A8D892|nr:LamG domain-containing protein [Winogradskyella sp.]